MNIDKNKNEFTEDKILWTNIAEASSFDKQQQQVFNVNRNEILVLKIDQEYKAIQSRCPHAGLSMKGSPLNLENDSIICKWHNTSFCYKTGDVQKWVDVSPFQKKIAYFIARFSKKMKEMTEMEPSSIETFKTQVIENNVWVGISIGD